MRYNVNYKNRYKKCAVFSTSSPASRPHHRWRPFETDSLTSRTPPPPRALPVCRIDAGTLHDSSASRNAYTVARLGLLKSASSTGLYGIRLTCDAKFLAYNNRPNSSGVLHGIVHPTEQRVLKRHPSTRGDKVLLAILQ